MASSDKLRADTAASQPSGDKARPQQSDRRDGVSSTGGQNARSAGERSSNRPDRRGAQASRHVHVDVRPERYLVASTFGANGEALTQALKAEPEIAVVRKFTSASALPASSVAVIEATAERAAALARRPDIYVEADEALGWHTPTRTVPDTGADVITARVGNPIPMQVEVLDDGGRPIDGAAVWIFGRGLPAAGFTGADGRADLQVAADTAADIGEIQVLPARGCWPTRLSRPRLRAGRIVDVVCERVTTTFPDFPDHALPSWGAQVMGFNRLPPTHRGSGVRIAIVDSGAAGGHPDLVGRLAEGRDVVGQDDRTWQEDRMGTGTHLAVLIGGRDDGTGVVGLAPEAELHILRTAPGGHCADLIESLDFCIDQQIDIALLAPGLTGESRLLASRIAEARNRGVACIAAAGDGSAQVGIPAMLPGVLSVGAIGRLGTFPPDSGLVTQLTAPPTPEGFFVPRFASHGPGIDCCAPGVAIVSGLPPASYGPLSGTAIAAGHVAAVAALVLAHHPQFAWSAAGPPAARDASRVDRLFGIILASCRSLPELGPLRVGSGLPDAGVAVGVAPWGDFATLLPAVRIFGDQSANGADSLANLEAVMMSAGLLPRS